MSIETQPNKSLQPTPAGVASSADAGHVVVPAWLSFVRSLLQRRGMKMRGSFCNFVFASWLIAAASSAADDTDARQYAEDGVATLQKEYDRLRDASSAGSISATDLQRREDDLLDARLLLLRLKNDTHGVTRLLGDEVDRRKQQLRGIEKMADRGYVSADQVSDATLRVLCAQLRLANQTNDPELKTRTLKTAVATEEKKLKSMFDLAARGYASRSEIAAQKLRIARIIADEEIAIPQSSEQ